MKYSSSLILPIFTILSASFVFTAPCNAQNAAAGASKSVVDAGDCRTYFKTDYRAVNRITDYGNGRFRLADWTGDGKSDFWGFRPHAGNSTVDAVIYPSLASGYWNWENPIIFTTTLPTNTNTSTGTYTVRDFDSDGRTDLIISGTASGTTVVYRDNGAGALVTLAANSVESGRFADINSDGILDLVATLGVPGVGNTLGYRFGAADGTFGSRIVIHTTLETQFQWVIADINGDHQTDIVLMAINASGSRIFINEGGGNFVTTNCPIHDYGVPFVADFNNDGRADILWTYSGAQLYSMSIFYGQADGTLTESAIPNTANYQAAYKITELNGDQYPDIIQYTQDQYTTYINDGAGGFTPRTYTPGLIVHTQLLVFEDFDGDGKADVLDNSHNTYNVFGEEVVFVRSNTCSTLLGETGRPNFDGSALGDLVLWNQSNGLWSSREGDFWSVVTYHPVVTRNWGGGSFGDIPVMGDFDGDGRTDYAVYRNPEGNWYILQSSTATLLGMHFGAPEDIPVPNDFDGAGKSDIAVFRPSEGNWHVWSIETQSYAGTHFGANGDKPVPADYDGDGKTDIAVFRPSEGNWYWLRSSDQGFQGVHWGVSTDRLLPADYDGDGKADLTVVRSGIWYILRSYNGSYGIIPFGVTSDIPIAFNREGDMAEPVVYRSSQRQWLDYRFTFGFEMPIGSGAPVNFGFPGN